MRFHMFFLVLTTTATFALTGSLESSAGTSSLTWDSDSETPGAQGGDGTWGNGLSGWWNHSTSTNVDFNNGDNVTFGAPGGTVTVPGRVETPRIEFLSDHIITGIGTITSTSGLLTIVSGTSNTGVLGTNDQRIGVVIHDPDGSTSLALVKLNDNQLSLGRANTYSGGTTITSGRINANHTEAFGTTGSVAASGTGQAYLTQTGDYANDFVISGSGPTEAAGTFGAIRFQNSEVSGDVTVSGNARILAYGNTTGTISGKLLGSADLEINQAGNAGSNGAFNITGDAAAYTGTMTVSRGAVHVGAVGGSVVVKYGTANISGPVAGTATVDGGTMILDDGASIDDLNFGSAGGGLILNPGSTVNDDIDTRLTGTASVSIGGTAIGHVLVDPLTWLYLAGGSVGGNLNIGIDGASTNKITFKETVAVASDLVLRGNHEVDLKTIPLPGTPAVLCTYGGTASDPDDGDYLANFSLDPAANYRSVAFSDPGAGIDGSIEVTIGGEDNKWVGSDATNPFFWDGVTPNCSSSDNLCFDGDAITFDDTAVSHNVDMQTFVSPYSITVNNDIYDYIINGSGISGSTGITKTGSKMLNLGGTNDFTGPVDIQAGVCRTVTPEALGLTSLVTIALDAQLDINGMKLGGGSRSYVWAIAGAGPDGLGAITNSSPTGVGANAGIQYILLTDDASIGGNGGRFDFGRANGFFDGGIFGNGHTLTKVGTNQVNFRGDAPGLVLVIAGGTAVAENTDLAFGDSTGLVTVKGGATVSTFGNRKMFTPLILEDGSTLRNQGGGTGVWAGPIEAAGLVQIGVSNHPLVLSGDITGDASINKGPGILFVENTDNSSYTGKWFVNLGTIVMVADGSFGAVPSGPIANAITMGNARFATGNRNGPVTVTVHANRGITVTGAAIFDAQDGGDLTIHSPVTGSGSLIKEGDGPLNLNGNMTYTGPTQVNEGLLRINGMQTGAGPCTVNLGATLGGTGSTDCDLTVKSGATLDPGASIGTLSMAGDVTIEGKLVIELDGTDAGMTDLLAVVGNLDITAATIDFNELVAVDDAAYIFASYGTLTGTEFATIADPLPDGYVIDYLYEGSNQIALVGPGVSFLEGDFNEDTFVNELDLDDFQIGFGMTENAVHGDGDADADQDVDGNDFLVWQRQVGQSNAAGSEASQAIPEPASLLLIGIALLATGWYRRG